MELPAGVRAAVSVGDGLTEALRSLRRAVATVRSYPTGNELTERALRDLAQRLGAALPIKLALGPGEVQDAGGRAIPLDEGMSHLIGDLYRDGVRELRLDARLARPELDRLVTALATPLDTQNLTEDYVTRLWEAELPSVGLRALDPYLDREIPGDVLEGKQQPSGEMEGISPDLQPSLPPPPETAFQLSEEDRQSLAKEIAQTAGAPPWRALIGALVEVAASPVATRRVADLVAVIETLLHRLMNDAQLGLALELLNRVRAETHLPPAELESVIARAAREERLASLCAIVDRDPSGHAAARQLCTALGEPALPALSAFFASAQATGSRRFWAETIGTLGPAGLDRLGEVLSGPDVECAAAAARVLAARAAARFAPAVWRAFASAPGASRRELLRAALALAPSAEPLVDVALRDGDADCRLIALGELKPPADPQVEARLLQRLAERDAEWLTDREKDALYRALAAVGDARAVEFFAAQLSGGWFARAERTDQTRAARALARMASPRAGEILREKAAGHGTVAALCQRALGEKPGRAS